MYYLYTTGVVALSHFYFNPLYIPSFPRRRESTGNPMQRVFAKQPAVAWALPTDRVWQRIGVKITALFTSQRSSENLGFVGGSENIEPALKDCFAIFIRGQSPRYAVSLRSNVCKTVAEIQKWIPACAGMTAWGNFCLIDGLFSQKSPHYKLKNKQP